MIECDDEISRSQRYPQFRLLSADLCFVTPNCFLLLCSRLVLFFFYYEGQLRAAQNCNVVGHPNKITYLFAS